jgi:hypothetical protein
VRRCVRAVCSGRASKMTRFMPRSCPTPRGTRGDSRNGFGGLPRVTFRSRQSLLSGVTLERRVRPRGRDAYRGRPAAERG